MSYKLTPEEIRRRAREISWPQPQIRAVADILKLIEDATGETIPEPFDESKVRHGSVWAFRGRSVLVRSGLKSSECAFLLNVTTGYIGREELCERSWDAWARILKQSNSTYLGQYDFTAGLPKGGAK